MRPFIVAGNWKMHGSHAFVDALLSDLIRIVADNAAHADLIVFPPTIFIPLLQSKLADFPIAYGAQNVSQFEQGAYTGEISTSMLLDFGCQYVLVGHSERRHVFGETNAQVAAKYIKAQQAGLVPVLCVGETEHERNNGQTEQVIQAQLQAVIQQLPARNDLFLHSIVAYEPVWAIGTGNTATPEQAQQIHAFIRNYLTEIGQSQINELPILYGGSVKVDNAAQIFQMSDIDGALVGGASLSADSFMGIAACNKSS